MSPIEPSAASPFLRHPPSLAALFGSTEAGIARKLPDACLVRREQIGDQNAIDPHACQVGVCDRGICEIDIGKRDFEKIDPSEFRLAKIHILKATVHQIGIGKMRVGNIGIVNMQDFAKIVFHGAAR
jgi:hypothetical protein